MGPSDVLVNSANRTTRLLEAVLAVSSGSDVDETLRRVVQATVDLVGSRQGILRILGRPGKPDRLVSAGDSLGADGVADAADDVAASETDDGPLGTAVFSAVAGSYGALRVDDAARDLVSAGIFVNDPPPPAVLDAPIRWGENVVGRLCLTGKVAAGSFTDDDAVTVRAVADGIGVAMNWARQIEETRRDQRWSEAIGDVATEMLGHGDLVRGMRLIADRALQLSGSDVAMVLLPPAGGPDGLAGKDIRIGAGAGIEPEMLRDLTLPAAGSAAGAVLADEKSRRVDTEFRRPGFPVALGPSMLAPLQPGPTGSVLMVARAPGSTVFDEGDLTRLTMFAENAALALHLAEAQRRRELRVLAERDARTRAHYDDVLQRLFAVGLAMQTTPDDPRLPNSPERIGDHLGTLQSVIRDVRQAIVDLPPARADIPRVRTSLAQLITSLTPGNAQMVTVRFTGPLDDLPGDLLVHARAVLHEAVGNAVRQGHAGELTIAITVDDELTIEVIDNGAGGGGAGDSSGTRLANLCWDMINVPGTLAVDRPDAGGARVVWTAPLPTPDGVRGKRRGGPVSPGGWA